MSAHRLVSRRRFIQLSSLAVASAPAWIGCSRFQPVVSLSAGQLALVAAIADQIIPPDDDPGGKDADVARFIEQQLRGPYERFASTYRDGLRKLDETSARLAGRSFVDLPFDRQTRVLAAIEADRVPSGIWRAREAPGFFHLITDHCLQGFYGSPRHGGNRDGVSWRMLHLDYPQIAGRVIV